MTDLHEIAQLMRIFSNATSIKTLLILSKNPQCVKSLIKEIGNITQGNLSQYLTKLRLMNIVDYDIVGIYRIYRISENCPPFVLTILREIKAEFPPEDGDKIELTERRRLALQEKREMEANGLERAD